MKMRTVMTATLAAAFALPLAAAAAGDKSAKDNAGAEQMFKSLDKNKDGFLSREEAKGTPHDKEFSSLDKNHDGKLSRAEHAAAPEHAGGTPTGTGATAGETMSSGTSGASRATSPGGNSGPPAKGKSY